MTALAQNARAQAPSLHRGRILIRRFLLIGVDYAILVGIKRPMCSIHLLGRECQLETIFPRTKAHRVIAPVGAHHATGERARVHQLRQRSRVMTVLFVVEDRKSTRLNSSHVRISYAVFCLKKKKKTLSNARYNTSHTRMMLAATCVR